MSDMDRQDRQKGMKRKPLRPEVEAAVNDIIHNHNVGSANEWLQRQYIRLMKREAANKKNTNESKCSNFNEHNTTA